MNASQRWIAAVATAAAGLLVICPALAGSTVHTQAAGDWNNPATWVGTTVPQDGDTAVVDHSVTLTNATASLAAYTINAGKTNTFCTTNAILNARQVIVYGTLTHTNNTATTTNTLGQWVPNGRVFVICSNLFVDAAGSIIGDALGYAGAPNNTLTNGYGPGGGGDRANSGGGGGGYGGQGGNNNVPMGAGSTNGVASAPDQPGSGGGGEYIGGATGPGGAGGGLIWIQATQGTVTVNGRISANGAYLASNALQRCGGGSGGGIYIRCSTFAGTNGTVSALGGWAGQFFPGGGGGGRIAVVVDPIAQSSAPPVSVCFQCAGGAGQSGGSNGWAGTVYVNEGRVLPTAWTNKAMNARLSGFSTWSPAQLAVTNCELAFDARVQVSAANGIVMASTNDSTKLILTNASTLQCGGNLVVSNASLYLYRDVDATVPTLTVGGAVAMSGGAAMYLYSAMTNALQPGYGALMSVTGNVTLTSGSWIYPFSHETNGGSVRFILGSNLMLADTNCGFSADGKGYAGAPQGVNTNGYGPGGGKSAGPGGGGNGGDGSGASDPSYRGLAYGTASVPQPGSGGGIKSGGGPAGWGGGLVWIQATQGTVTVNGRITANATLASPGSYWWAGGGAGGGIYLACKTLAGTNGVLSAQGGQSQIGGGSGGGGRIAVFFDPASQSNASLPTIGFYVGPGGQSTYTGSCGTVYIQDPRLLPNTWSGLGMSARLSPFAAWSPAQLTITNCALTIDNRVNLTVTNDMTIAGSGVPTQVALTNASSLTCGGNLTVSNASLYLCRDVDTTPPPSWSTGTCR